ncbi:MAG: hypothetical protein WCF99_00400 [Chloroflexales bacterium]
MELKRFRVTNFRSVIDSGWIELDRVAALIGVNESGKTNLLLPLWKLNPAREGEIQPTSDYPKKLFGEIRDAPKQFCFICAEFQTGELAVKLADISGAEPSTLEVVQVSRYYDGSYQIAFPECHPLRMLHSSEVQPVLEAAYGDIESAKTLQKEENSKAEILEALRDSIDAVAGVEALTSSSLHPILERLRKLVPSDPAKTSMVIPRLLQVLEAVEEMIQRLSLPEPGSVKEVITAVRAALPKFVYYSNYGNLDSEIYLPHVVVNLKRSDLGPREGAKARTLRVLFKFVRLSPEEILELGKDFKDLNSPARQPTEEEISQIADKKT